MLDKFAEELHEAREKSGLSLQQMTMKTRIDIKFLDAIDKGDFTFLSEPYVKAFIKDFAKMVGLDENVTLQKYEAAKKGKELDEVTAEERGKKSGQAKNVQAYDATPPPSVPASANANKNLILYGIIAGGAILFFILIYFLFFQSSTEIVVSEKPLEEVIEDNKQRYVEESPQVIPNSTGKSDSLFLSIFSDDTSWVQIIFDDNAKEEFTLFPNSQKIIKAGNNFKITLGNSGAVKFQMNNKPVVFNGKAGSIQYVQINREGLTYLQTPPALE